ncbi:hypothetical protein BLNAU_325 [Blattamonas nauphoetae]|uniref:Uncharacterized protein n=1 Tax=Blattamonas nauphoetae TaxID=2049346 RepID=A0ABQ9YKX8_9EUKA|nr:hypothetical protein BLNAU_325 [Blattamonas nauphoetae]
MTSSKQSLSQIEQSLKEIDQEIQMIKDGTHPSVRTKLADAHAQFAQQLQNIEDQQQETLKEMEQAHKGRLRAVEQSYMENHLRLAEYIQGEHLRLVFDSSQSKKVESVPTTNQNHSHIFEQSYLYFSRDLYDCGDFGDHDESSWCEVNGLSESLLSFGENDPYISSARYPTSRSSPILAPQFLQRSESPSGSVQRIRRTESKRFRNREDFYKHLKSQIQVTHAAPIQFTHSLRSYFGGVGTPSQQESGQLGTGNRRTPSFIYESHKSNLPHSLFPLSGEYLSTTRPILPIQAFTEKSGLEPTQIENPKSYFISPSNPCGVLSDLSPAALPDKPVGVLIGSIHRRVASQLTEPRTSLTETQIKQDISVLLSSHQTDSVVPATSPSAPPSPLIQTPPEPVVERDPSPFSDSDSLFADSTEDEDDDVVSIFGHSRPASPNKSPVQPLPPKHTQCDALSRVREALDHPRSNVASIDNQIFVLNGQAFILNAFLSISSPQLYHGFTGKLEEIEDDHVIILTPDGVRHRFMFSWFRRYPADVQHAY